MGHKEWPTFSEVKQRLETACRQLVERDSKLFEFDVNERTLTQRLSLYLQHEFPGYTVDCEYNRNMDRPKRMPVQPTTVQSDDINGVTVFPDVVVHQRGTHESNLLVIEAKKDASNGNVPERDRHKLKGFTDPSGDFQYRWGAFVDFRNRDGKAVFTITWFLHGRELAEEEVKHAIRSDAKEKLGYGG